MYKSGKLFCFPQVTPNGDKLCMRCDHTILAMKAMTTSILATHKIASSLGDAPTSSQSAEAVKPNQTEAKQEADGPNKKVKICEFAVDDEVKYFDTKTGKNNEGIVIRIVSSDVCVIGTKGQRPFFMNVQWMSKK